MTPKMNHGGYCPKSEFGGLIWCAACHEAYLKISDARAAVIEAARRLAKAPYSPGPHHDLNDAVDALERLEKETKE